MARYLELEDAKKAAQLGANACGQRVYFYRSGRMWETALEPHPEYSTNPFNYYDPKKPNVEAHRIIDEERAQ